MRIVKNKSQHQKDISCARNELEAILNTKKNLIWDFDDDFSYKCKVILLKSTNTIRLRFRSRELKHNGSCKIKNIDIKLI